MAFQQVLVCRHSGCGLERVMFHLRICALAAAIFFTGLAVSSAAEDPFTFSAPKGWRSERIPFPLGFAPEMKYRGFEELRFGPGMFKPKSETYWTYGFFWWLEGKQAIDEETLKRDLEIYYKGLSKAVGGSRNPRLDLDKVSAKVAKASPETKDSAKGAHRVQHTAKLTTYDAFVTGKLLELNVEISKRYFPELDRTWVWFSVSPKPTGDAVWTSMRSIRDSFKARK
jgi:hypothetical protein